MNSVRATSISAYRGLKHENTQSQRIHETIEDMGAATIRMVAKKLSMEISTVSARINKLVKDGYLEEAYRDKDPFSGVRSIFWKATEGQTELFREYGDTH
jgi:DNA-binding MarR family transcriptional regulator